jgi:CRP/FNR family cyclic AMP-dependent transcriptional regulator
MSHMETLITGATTNRAPRSITGASGSGRIDLLNWLTGGQSILAHLPEGDLLSLLRHPVVRTYTKRDCIYYRGEPGRTMIVVLDGFVKLSSTTDDGQEVLLEIAGPGMCFGELAVFNDWPRDSDATALSRCRLLAIDGREFRQVMGRDPSAMQTMVRSASQQLQRMTERVLDTVELSMPARLSKALLYLAQIQSSTARDGVRIELRMSQAELGAMIGLTRESVNKQLAILRDAGLIAMCAGAVTLRDIPALRRASRGDGGSWAAPMKLHGGLTQFGVPMRDRPPGQRPGTWV